jgi:hypothetical protein
MDIAKTESELVRSIRKRLGRGLSRIFRNNTGQAFFPKTQHGREMIQQMLRNGHLSRVKYGLVNGSSDLIGWDSIEITPDMVGQRLAVFVAVEAKRPGGGGRSTSSQRNFVKAVRAAGGRAGFARSVEEAETICKGDTDGGKEGS